MPLYKLRVMSAKRLAEMIKTLLIISAVFIVTNCASSKPEPNPTSLNPESATQTENAELAEEVKLAEEVERVENNPPEEERVYCRRERITGSHRKTKTCLTKAEMEASRKASRDYVDRLKMTPELKGESGG